MVDAPFSAGSDVACLPFIDGHVQADQLRIVRQLAGHWIVYSGTSVLSMEATGYEEANKGITCVINRPSLMQTTVSDD